MDSGERAAVDPGVLMNVGTGRHTPFMGRPNYIDWKRGGEEGKTARDRNAGPRDPASPQRDDERRTATGPPSRGYSQCPLTHCQSLPAKRQ